MRINQPFPLDAWYAAAWGQDVASAPLGRRICGKPVVLYRKQDGTAAALEDACLHRLLPLSMGRIEGDMLVCGYHGMTFDGAGKCVRMPLPGETPPPGARVGSYPLVERYGLIWLWMGNPELADPDLIPDLFWLNDPEWAWAPGFIEMDCDYRLLIDNLMDLTHETFVHASSIGHNRIMEAPFEVAQEENSVTLTRWMIDGDAPPFMAKQLHDARGLTGDHVDRWQIIKFEAPATIVIKVGLAKTGTGAQEGNFSQGFRGRVINTITPQGDGKCLYFFAYARDYNIGDQALSKQVIDGITNIFLEDKIVLEAQQKAIEEMPGRKLVNLNMDRGSLYARRAIERMLQSEAELVDA